MFRIKLFIQVYLFSQLNFWCFAVAAQEPLNSQLQFSNLSRNPALAGMQVSDLFVNVNYQPQNQSYLIPYKVLQVQIEARFQLNENRNGFTAGTLIKYDEVGINHLKRAQFLPVLNFHKSLSDVRVCFLNMAFMPGIFKTQYDQLNLPSIKNFNPIPFNPANPVPQIISANSSSYFDFSTGVSFYEALNNQISFYLGAALFHFSQNVFKQNQSISKLPREWIINSGLYFNHNYILQILADVRINQFGTTFYGGSVIGFPITKNLLNQTSEFNIGTYYNSRQELSPIIYLKQPNTCFSLSYTFYTGSTKGMPILPNAFECNASININTHYKTNESEKMKCAKNW